MVPCTVQAVILVHLSARFSQPFRGGHSFGILEGPTPGDDRSKEGPASPREARLLHFALIWFLSSLFVVEPFPALLLDPPFSHDFLLSIPHRNPSF